MSAAGSPGDGPAPGQLEVLDPRARLLRGVLVAGFVGAHACALALYLWGDTLRYPVVQYFFTWDMFPHHYSESVRRVAVGRTRSGRLLRLHPAGAQRFRGGVHGDMTRVDLDRRGAYYKHVVEQTRRAAAARDPFDPIVHVWLFERYWPVKYNFSDVDYQAWMGQPKPWLRDPLAAQTYRSAAAPWPPPRTWWRLREQYDVPLPATPE